MILEYRNLQKHHDDAPIADPTQEPDPQLQALPGSRDNLQAELPAQKKTLGLLRLVPRLINERSMYHLASIKTVVAPVWDFFASRMTTRGNPEQQLQSCVLDVMGAWQDELKALVCGTFFMPEAHSPVGLGDEDVQAHTLRLFDLTTQLLKYRAQSLVMEVAEPPGRYAHAASADPDVALSALATMKDSWQTLLEMETAHAQSPKDVLPLQDISWTYKVLIRAMFMAFEADDWAPASIHGQNSLRSLMKALGDSKCIEDAHKEVKTASLGNLNSTMTVGRMMSACIKSNILQQRVVPHVAVSMEDVAKKADTGFRGHKYRNLCESKTCKLAAEMQDIMDPKAWQGTGPSSFFPSAAATQWLFHWPLTKCHNVPLNAGMLSSLVSDVELVSTWRLRNTSLWSLHQPGHSWAGPWSWCRTDAGC